MKIVKYHTIAKEFYPFASNLPNRRFRIKWEEHGVETKGVGPGDGWFAFYPRVP